MRYELPGRAAEVTVSPMRWPIDPHSALSLHGALSTVLGVPHRQDGASNAPNFVIRGHVGGGVLAVNYHNVSRLPPVSVHFLDGAARALDGFDAPVVVWGAVRRLRVRVYDSPTVVEVGGGARLRCESVSPLIVRGTGCAREATAIDGDLLNGCLCAMQRKLGVDGGAALMHGMRAQVTRQRHRSFSTGWSERVRGGVEWCADVEADEAAHLWLRVGEYLGVGTYVSRGFGRYRAQAL